MKTNLRILWCGLGLSFFPLFAAASAESLLDKVLPPLPQTDTNQVSGIFYVAALSGTVECRAEKITELKKGDVINARGASVRTKDKSTVTIVFSNHTSIFVQENTDFRIEKFDQEPFAPNNNLLIEPSNSQLVVFVRLGQLVVSTPQLLSGTRIVFESPQAACYVVNDQSGGEKAFLQVSPSQTHFAMITGMGLVKIREQDGTLGSIGTRVPANQQAFVRYAWSGKADDEDKNHPLSVDVKAGTGGVPAAGSSGLTGDTAYAAANTARTPWGVSIPADQFYIAALNGTAQCTSHDQTFNLKQGDLLVARGAIIKTAADSNVSIVLGNETRLAVSQKTELKFDKFDQEAFKPNNNLDIEPSNSQTVVLMRSGQMDIDTPQLLSGTTLVFETPHGAIALQNNQSGGQQSSLQVTDKQTVVQMITGLATVRPKGPDGAFVSIGYNLPTGQFAVVKPALGADPTLGTASFDEIKAAAGVPIPNAGEFAVRQSVGAVTCTAGGKTFALHRGDTVPGSGATVKTTAGATVTLLFSNQATLALAEKSGLTVARFTQQPQRDAGLAGVETSASNSLFRLDAGSVTLDAPQLAVSSSLVIETVHSSISIPTEQTGGAQATITLTDQNTQCQMITGLAEIKQRGLDGRFVSSGTPAKAGDLAIIRPLLAAGSGPAPTAASITHVDIDPAPVAPPGAAEVTVSGSAEVLRVAGSARYFLPDQPTAVDLTQGTKLPVGAVVETGVGAEAYVSPYPGAVAVLRPGSRMRIEKLSITTAGDVLMRREIIFDLKEGNLVSMIDPAKHNINRYAVRTPKGLANARGTAFTTSVTGEDMTVSTTADSVTFTTPGGTSYTINAGNVTVNTNGGPAEAPVSLAQEVASNPAFAGVVQTAMTTVSNIVQNNIGNLPTNSAANLMAQVASVAAAAMPANAAAFTTQAVTAVTASGSSTGSQPGPAAAAVVAAIATAAPAQVSAITTAGVQASPSQMSSVAGAAALAVPTQAGAVTTAVLQAYSTANPNASNANFAQTANSVAAVVANAAPGSAAGVASAAMTAITQNNPNASAASLTQSATNLAATVTAQAPAQGGAVATALIGVVSTASPGANTGQVTSSVNAGVTVGQQVAANNGGGSNQGGNGANGGNGGGGGNGSSPTAVVITQGNGGNGGGGGNNNGGGGNFASNGNGGNGDGGNAGNAGNGGGANGGNNGGGNNGGNRGGGDDGGGRQSTSVVISALTGGNTSSGGNSQATSVLVTQLNGGQQASIAAAVTAASNAQSTVSFSTSSGSSNGGPPTIVANPTSPTTPPTNFTVSSANLGQ